MASAAALMLAMLVTFRTGAAQSVGAPAGDPKTPQVQVRGKVVCLAEEMHRLYETDLPTDHPHLYGFKTEAGVFYTLLRTRYSEALFADEELRKKDLLLKGRLLGDGKILDVATIRSVVGGVIHDVYYFCTICNIIAIAPGICDCCREPVEFVEKPVQ